MTPLSPGTVLQQRYTVVKLLGKGGMGAVYQATDKKFGNTVALKQMIVTGEALKAAFEREAILLNGLRHAALPVVFDHFTEGDGHFLVMQFIPGKDLAEMLTAQGGPFPPGQVAKWADQLLDALEYLHGRTPPIIHRDIKPQNVKLTPEDDIVLLDFGLAKGDLSGDAAQQQRSLVGYTPIFASLEQMRGLATDPRSDLYSAAATIYSLLTGQPPVDALTRADALLAGKPDPLPLASDVNPQVPRAVAEVVRQAMAVSRDERLASAKDMRRQLRAAFRGIRAGTDELGATIIQPHVVAPPPAPLVGASAARSAPAGRFCVACGASLVEGAKFCMKCGKPNPPVATPPGLPLSAPPPVSAPLAATAPSVPPQRLGGTAPFHSSASSPSGALTASEIVLLFGDFFAPPAAASQPWTRLLHTPTRVSAAVLAQAIWAAAFLDCERQGAITLTPVAATGGAAELAYALKAPTVGFAPYSLEANIIEMAQLRLGPPGPLSVAAVIADIIRFDSRNAWRHTAGMVKLGLNRRSLLAMTPSPLHAPFPVGRFALTPHVIELARRASPEPVQRLLAAAQSQSARWSLLIQAINLGLQRRTNPMLTHLPELDQDA
ncbi:MAG: protein kinase [Chloracidobacterium sp.]|nr:protein kinase [Chloracidobacterium sp.]MDW8218222.1 protein kinase [Acidobacteriota bacterium]